MPSSSSSSASSGTPPGSFPWRGHRVQVVDVWESNVEAEITRIRKLADRFPYVAMDTEFPGLVVRSLPGASSRDVEAYHYQTIRVNVDLLQMLQVGLALFDKDGNMPPGNPVWQINFRFDLTKDIATAESIGLLARAGIDFERLSTEGVEHEHFGALLTVSGLVLVEGAKWVTFHSGYDFAYLLKVLTNKPLPETAGGFFDAVKQFFPSVLDCKCLASEMPKRPVMGSLAQVCKILGVERPPTAPQAGAGALLIMGCFLEISKALRSASFQDRFNWRLFGLAGGDGKPIPSEKSGTVDRSVSELARHR